MLPSGNDAAHCLAEYFGGLLEQQALKKEAEAAREEERLIA